jgi:uncharacterized cupredoxin-like copper-binding protein
VAPSLGIQAADIPFGTTTTLLFTAPTQPGSYQFWCAIPGHAEAGMVGEVIVK